jgi:nucleoid DNA-binding protein
MNKGDLINEVAKLVSTKKQAQEVVDCVFSAVTDTLKKNESGSDRRFWQFQNRQA